MVVYNPDTGVFSSISTTDGTLTALGSITLDGVIVEGIRDIVYNPSNETVYASSKSNDPYGGKIYSVNPSTLEATVINDNANDDWYALPGIEMSNGKILGTVYWDDYNEVDYSTGLVWLNLDGSISDTSPLLNAGEYYYFSEGMAIEYGASNNEIYITNEEEIIIADINGNITETIDLTGSGFPMEDSLDSIRTIETDDDGIIYGIDRDGHFGTIDLITGVFAYIATLPSDKIVALSKIPENIFE